MKESKFDIQIISAPSILGLKPTGVELLPESLLKTGLNTLIEKKNPLINAPAPNHLYSYERDSETNCLNPGIIRNYSIDLGKVVYETIHANCFALVLGGDCSILIGIMQALKAKGKYGLVFLDAHADFYQPDKSPTGEIADMDLAIVTGRGPELLTNINNRRPYVEDELVIHVGQRDWEETNEFRSEDIRKTRMKCISLAELRSMGVTKIVKTITHHKVDLAADGFWIHFDTDVLSDNINPAVDYRLPGGLEIDEVEELLKAQMRDPGTIGMSVTIFNPRLDPDGSISRKIAGLINRCIV